MKLNNFHKTFASLALFGLIILLSGCPYSSTVPIDDGSAKVPDVTGKWIKAADKESENPTYFEISLVNKTEATALKYEYSSNDSTYESTKYHLTFSDVNGDLFMNVIEDGGSSYYLYKFSMDASTGEITTYEVTDYIKETFNSSQDLKNFISKNKSASYFYTNSVDTYVKM